MSVIELERFRLELEGPGLNLGPHYINQLLGSNFRLPGQAFFKAHEPKNNLNAKTYSVKPIRLDPARPLAQKKLKPKKFRLVPSLIKIVKTGICFRLVFLTEEQVNNSQLDRLIKTSCNNKIISALR